MRQVKPTKLRLVHGKSDHRVLDGKDYLEKAIEAFQNEMNAIQNPAPLGVWMVRPLNKKPQYRWEYGKDRRGEPKVRSKSISLREAATWERRRASREQKQKLEAAIQSLEEVLFNLHL